jgi:hypothetical protein
MSGVDHYRQAERLLEGGRQGETVEEAAVRIAEAQVHATLALAAAAVADYGIGDDQRAWHQAAGVQPAPPPETDPQAEWAEYERTRPPGEAERGRR